MYTCTFQCLSLCFSSPAYLPHRYTRPIHAYIICGLQHTPGGVCKSFLVVHCSDLKFGVTGPYLRVHLKINSSRLKDVHISVCSNICMPAFMWGCILLGEWCFVYLPVRGVSASPQSGHMSSPSLPKTCLPALLSHPLDLICWSPKTLSILAWAQTSSPVYGLISLSFWRP